MAASNPTTEAIPEADATRARQAERADERRGMVAGQIEARGVRNRHVLETLRRVERHRRAMLRRRADGGDAGGALRHNRRHRRRTR